MLLTVCWSNGDVELTLEVPCDTWAKIVAGEQVKLVDQGYSYDGDEFVDSWGFHGGLDGQLTVTYEQPESPFSVGTGIICKLREVLPTTEVFSCER